MGGRGTAGPRCRTVGDLAALATVRVGDEWPWNLELSRIDANRIGNRWPHLDHDRGFVDSPKRIELRQAAFLLTRGPYAYSRNPMYVSELALWLGWAVFYGNISVLIGFVILFAVLVPGARYEERVLEARFGDAYRAYRGRVPRWLGLRRQRGRS